MNPQDDIAAARAAVTALRDAGNAATPTDGHGWHVCPPDHPDFGGAVVIGPDRGMICDANIFGGPNRSDDENMANARFIALSRNMTPAICELLLGHLDAHEAAEAEWEALCAEEPQDEPPRIGDEPHINSDLGYMRTLTAKLAALGRAGCDTQ